MKFKEKYYILIKDWENKISENEWFFSDVEDEITKGLSPGEAFDLIPQAVDLILEQTDDFLVYETLLLLRSLAIISGTTEMPKFLEQKWDELINKLESTEDLQKRNIDELRRWYRKYN